MVERSHRPSDDAEVPTIRDLIQAVIDAGETQSEIARRVPGITDAQLSKIRKQPVKSWPEIDTVRALAMACRVDETAIVLAYARELGLRISRDADPAIMLPELAMLTAEQGRLISSVARAILAAAQGAGTQPDVDDGEAGRGSVPSGADGGVHRLRPVQEQRRPAARRAPNPSAAEHPPE